MAVAWALDLDAQFRQLLLAGASPLITIPARQSFVDSRPIKENISGYRTLRLGVGEMLHPLFAGEPDLTALYAFQRRGVEWLRAKSGAILADDMGLGKTVQVIAAMRLLFSQAQIRSALVMCPKGLIPTWEAELGIWAPELSVAVVTPRASIRATAWNTIVGRRHVLLTNYEHLRTIPEALALSPPDLAIADEAHRLKNRRARITAGGFRLAPKTFWALSGTPLERDLEDLATLLALVAPAAFAPSHGKHHPSSLRSRARPYVLRRRKEDVLDELPPVLDGTEVLELTASQRKAYDGAIAHHRKKQSGKEQLSLLSQLLALCDLEPKSRRSCKIDRILEHLSDIRRHGEKAVVFSYRLEPLRILRERIKKKWGADAAGLLIGSMDFSERTDAVAKFRASSDTFVLLASSRIAGEGLTLVEANHVFLFNQWWNPSANDQARDRVVRIGQRRKVRVYRFCCRETIEDTLSSVLKDKRALFANTVERLAQDDDRGWMAMLEKVGLDSILTAAKS